VAEEPYDGSTLAAVLDDVRRRRGAELAKILARCSFLVDDSPVGGRDHASVTLSDGGSVEVLPPFAGG
jgi:sulfur carrier protein ThiS